MIGALWEIGIWIDISTKAHPSSWMLVSRSDLELANQQKWSHDKNGYAVARINNKKQSFHRLCTKAPKGILVDHKNRDRLDNRQSNLRFASRSLNTHNAPNKPPGASKYRGVYWHKRDRVWRAQIRINNRLITLGRYPSQIEAAKAYDQAARDRYGDAAVVNLSHALPTHLQSEMI